MTLSCAAISLTSLRFETTQIVVVVEHPIKVCATGTTVGKVSYESLKHKGLPEMSGHVVEIAPLGQQRGWTHVRAA